MPGLPSPVPLAEPGLPSPVPLADLESVIWQSPLYDQEMREEEEELADSDDE